MSAYMVSRGHIRFLVEAAKRLSYPRNDFSWYVNERRHALQDIGDDACGQLLWDENRRSIEYRYPDTREDFTRAPGPAGESFEYRHLGVPNRGYIDSSRQEWIAQVFKACDCFEYQSCESDGWKDSEAHAFIQSLRSSAWHGLDGYESALWGAPDSWEPTQERARAAWFSWIAAGAEGDPPPGEPLRMTCQDCGRVMRCHADECVDEALAGVDSGVVS